MFFRKKIATIPSYPKLLSSNHSTSNLFATFHILKGFLLPYLSFLTKYRIFNNVNYEYMTDELQYLSHYNKFDKFSTFKFHFR